MFYLAPDGTLMAVDIDPAGKGFRAGQPRALFRATVDTAELGRGVRNHYVVGANGQRFLFASQLKSSGPPPVIVVLNWAAEREP